MHIAGKIFLGLGAVLLVLGGIMALGGGSTLDEVGDWDPEEKSEFSGTTGDTSYTYPGGWDKLVMVRDNVRCDEFTFQMTNGTGENHVKVECEWDGEKPLGWEDDPPDGITWLQSTHGSIRAENIPLRQMPITNSLMVGKS